MGSNDYKEKVFDFDCGMPLELKEAVFATDVYRRYIAERKRLNELAEERVRAGGKLSDPDMLKESAKMDKLTNQLTKVIKACARTVQKQSSRR